MKKNAEVDLKTTNFLFDHTHKDGSKQQLITATYFLSGLTVILNI